MTERPLSILLVEDNPGDARLLADMLLSFAQPVRLACAKTLAEGLEALSDRPSDVVLLDLSLPDSAGLATLGALLARNPQLPAIVLTGLSDQEVAMDALRAGAQDFLVKGHITAHLLERAIHYAIERKAAAEALRHANEALEQKVAERTQRWQTALDDLQQEVRDRLAAEDRRRRAEREVLHAVEREQRRIGRDLHDGIQGSLVGLHMMLESLRQRALRDAPPLQEPLAKAMEVVTATLQQTRGLARTLCPVDLKNAGLAGALRTLAQTTSGTFRTACELQFDGEVSVPDETVAAQLYYISHEAVTNALKHARPKRISISLKPAGDEIMLAVRDDGVGIAPDRCKLDGMGLRTMNYRASLIGATVRVGPCDSGGTEVVCLLPRQRAVAGQGGSPVA
jgi:signal transduction histidine kinase